MTQTDRILELARSKGILRTRDVDGAGASRALLASLTAEGRLLKLGRGLHTLPDRPASEYDGFAEVATRSPSGVLCLLSALRFHDLTTQQSSDVWLAIPHKARAPRFDYPPLRVVRMSGLAMTEGVEIADLAGAQVRVFSVAKTVADCFKFRSQVSTNVAYEALKNAWTQRKATSSELVHFAKLCRVYNIMRPYLETLSL